MATISLDQIQIASPCTADWDQMSGDERVRHCGQCDLNVYNLSDMANADAEALIRTHEGRLCVRLYRREDGTVITADCPVGLRAAARRVFRKTAASLAMVLVMLFAGAWAMARHRQNTTQQANGSAIVRFDPLGYLIKLIKPETIVSPPRWAEMGDMCVAVPKGPVTPTPTQAPAR